MTGHASVLGAIGGTPSIWLDRLAAAQGVEGRILAKLDHLNPGGSKKDRAALATIEAARADGSLAPGHTVVELTSGNMGTGLAIVCAVLGHPFVAVMSRGNSPERARMMRAAGAEVELVDQAEGSRPGEVSGADLQRVEDAAQTLTRKLGAYRADQFHNRANRAAHAQGTGPELWRDSCGTLDAFVDFAGSGGTFAGVMTALSPHGVAGYLVEPDGAAALSGQEVIAPRHPIQGGGYSMAELDLMEAVQPDGYLTVTGDEARRTARDLARREGVLCGYSAGANVAAALQLLAGDRAGQTVAVVICDSGMKYLSTDLWE